MKKFWSIVAVWFLIQLIVLAAGSAVNTLAAQQGQRTCNQGHRSLATAFFVGALFPLSQTTFVSPNWCWNLAQ